MKEKIKVLFTVTNTYTIILDKDEYVDDDGFIQEELLEEVCYDLVDQNILSIQDSHIEIEILDNE
jgi:hypothetical protein